MVFLGLSKRPLWHPSVCCFHFSTIFFHFSGFIFLGRFLPLFDCLTISLCVLHTLQARTVFVSLNFPPSWRRSICSKVAKSLAGLPFFCLFKLIFFLQ